MKSDVRKLSKTKYNLDKVELEIDYIVEMHGWYYNEKVYQISLQSPDENFHNGVSTPLKIIGHKETEYTQENLPPEWEISKFIKDNNLYRTRIMKLLPRSCYRLHWDKSKHVHLVVITDKKCKVVIDDIVHYIPADGHAYMVNTLKQHTAFNGTLDLERIHIIGCVGPNKENDGI